MPLKNWRCSLMHTFASGLTGRRKFEPTCCHSFHPNFLHVVGSAATIPFQICWALVPLAQQNRKKCSWGTHLARKGPGRQATARGFGAGKHPKFSCHTPSVKMSNWQKWWIFCPIRVTVQTLAETWRVYQFLQQAILQEEGTSHQTKSEQIVNRTS